MLIGIVGDIHGEFEALERVLALEVDVPAWFCVGDVASDAGEYPSPSRPFHFIQGNNEDFDVVAEMAAGMVSAALIFIPNGTSVDVMGVRVAGLGGTFAPKWFDTAPEDLPSGAGLQTSRAGGLSGPPKIRDDKRRHFVRAQVGACLALRDVDIFLTHEAPRPYWAGSGTRRNDAGKAIINEVLSAVRPRLHFFGHHHRFTEASREGVPSIGLPLVTQGYVLVETKGWTWEKRDLA